MLSGLGDHSQHGGLRLLISPLPLRAFLKVHGECHSACGGWGAPALWRVLTSQAVPSYFYSFQAPFVTSLPGNYVSCPDTKVSPMSSLFLGEF